MVYLLLTVWCNPKIANEPSTYIYDIQIIGNSEVRIAEIILISQNNYKKLHRVEGNAAYHDVQRGN